MLPSGLAFKKKVSAAGLKATLEIRRPGRSSARSQTFGLPGTGVGEESVQAELLPMIRKSIRELDERVEKESNQSEDWNAVIKQISDDEPYSLGFYADKFEWWTAGEIEALRCDVVETATEEELMAEVERRRRAGLLPKEASNDGFSDLVDDLLGKLDTDPDR